MVSESDGEDFDPGFTLHEVFGRIKTINPFGGCGEWCVKVGRRGSWFQVSVSDKPRKISDETGLGLN